MSVYLFLDSESPSWLTERQNSLTCAIRNSGTRDDEPTFSDSLLVYFYRYCLLETVLEVKVLEGNLCCLLKDYMIRRGLLIQLRRNPRDAFEVI